MPKQENSFTPPPIRSFTTPQAKTETAKRRTGESFDSWMMRLVEHDLIDEFDAKAEIKYRKKMESIQETLDADERFRAELLAEVSKEFGIQTGHELRHLPPAILKEAHQRLMRRKAKEEEEAKSTRNQPGTAEERGKASLIAGVAVPRFSQDIRARTEKDEIKSRARTGKTKKAREAARLEFLATTRGGGKKQSRRPIV